MTPRIRTGRFLLDLQLRHAATSSPLLDNSLDNGQPLQSISFGDHGLTSRESEVGYWLAQGKTNWEIGVILGIGSRTVEKHIEHVLTKLRVENRTGAALVLTELARSVMQEAEAGRLISRR